MFFGLSNPNDTLVNYAIDPVIREYDRMVYLALSEFFFDSGMFSYYKAGIFQMHIVNEKVTTTTDTPEPSQTSKTTRLPKNITDPQTTQTLKTDPPPKLPQTFKPPQNLKTITDIPNHHKHHKSLNKSKHPN